MWKTKFMIFFFLTVFSKFFFFLCTSVLCLQTLLLLMSLLDMAASFVVNYGSHRFKEYFIQSTQRSRGTFTLDSAKVTFAQRSIWSVLLLLAHLHLTHLNSLILLFKIPLAASDFPPGCGSETESGPTWLMCHSNMMGCSRVVHY